VVLHYFQRNPSTFAFVRGKLLQIGLLPPVDGRAMCIDFRSIETQEKGSIMTMNHTIRTRVCLALTAGLFVALIAVPAMAAPKVSTQTGPWEDTDTWGGTGAPGSSDDVFVASGHTVTINDLNTLGINSLSVSGVLNHADASTTESDKIILDIAGDCTVAAGGRIDVSARGYNSGQGPGYGGSGTRGGSHGGRGWSNHSTLYGETYGSITAPTNYGSGGQSTSGGGAVILEVDGETKVYGYIKANSGSGGNWQYAGSGGSVFLTTSNLVGTGTIEARCVANHFSGGGGRIAVVLTGSDTFGSVNMITYASQDVTGDGAAGTVYLEKESDTTDQGELVLNQNNYLGNGSWAVTAMSDRDATSYQFSRVTATNSGALVVGSDDSLNLTGATLGGEADGTCGVIVDGGTLTVGSTWTLTDLMVAIRAGSTFDVSSALTVGSGGTLAIDSSHTISGDVTVEDGGKLSHTGNSATEAYKIDLTIGGDLQVDAGGAVDVNDKGYATKQGPGYVTWGASHGGEGYNGSSPTYGSIVAPTNIGSGGSTYGGGGAAILTVEGEARVYGFIKANAPVAGNWQGAGAGGSVYLTTSNLVGTGTIQAHGGYAPQYPGGGGRVAVALTGAGSSFGSVAMTAYGGNGSANAAAGTVYKRTASQGANEGTLIIDQPQNSSYYASIGSLVTDASVRNVIIRNSGKLEVETDQTFQVSGNWSNDNVFVSETGGRVEFVGTDTATVFGSTTFKELVCTNVAKTINFEDGATTAVDEIFRFTGPSNTGLLLRSTLADTQWLLDVDAGATEVTVNYVDVKDSDAATAGGQSITATESKNSGNNDGWNFAVVGQTNWWTGGVNANWATDGNWSLGRPLAPIDGGIIISNNCDNYPTLPSEKTFPYFEMKNPSSLSLGGFNLTVEGGAAIAGTLTATGTELLTFEQDVNFTSGTFTQAQSTVLLAGTGAQSMTSASESCHRLTVTNSGRTVTFADAASATFFLNRSVSLAFDGGVTATEFRAYAADGSVTQEFAASSTSTITDMYLLGDTGKTNWLVSSSSGTKWNLDVDRIAYVKHANVEDSDADLGMTIYPIDSVDTGPNNDNWVFTEGWLTWHGSASSTFSAAANWTPETAPDASARVNIDGNGANAPVLTANASVKEVLLGSEETSSLDLATFSLTVGENVRVMGLGTLTASRPSTISNDVTVLDGGTITHNANSSTEANKLTLTIGGELQVNAGGEVNVDDKGYASRQGPGYVQYGASHGGVGFNGQGPAYGSIVAPTNCGSGGSTYAGGGAAILTVQGETRVYGFVGANATGSGSWHGSGAGGSVFLTTSNLVGTGTIQAQGGGVQQYPGGGGRVAVVLTGAGSSFGSVAMTAHGAAGSANAAAGTVYKRSASQGANEGTLIVDQPQNSSYYTSIDSLVTDASVGDVIIRNNGELKVETDATLQVGGNWSNGNAFVSDTGGRVEFVGTDTVTIFGDNTFKELVCTGVTKQINFEANQTTAVDEELIWSGPSDTTLVLRSTSPGDQWVLDVDSGITVLDVSYVDVKDSDARPDLGVTASTSIDSGNNSNWQFSATGQTNWWTGGSSTTWADNDNWSLGRPPSDIDGGVIISNNCSYYTALPSDKTFSYFEMKNPSSLSLGGSDLTVNDNAVIAGTLAATGTETLTFNGNVVNFTSGTFTQAQSTVLLAGTGAQSMTSDSESCYRLTVTNIGRTVTFADALSATYFRNESVSLAFDGGVTATEFRAYTTDGSITQEFAAASTSTITDMYLLGSAGKTNWLVSSSIGTKWNLDVDRIAYVKHANVEDSDADPGVTIYPVDSVDTGPNNDNWVFTEGWITWDGSASSDFSAAANWTPETAPDATARVNIDGNGGNAPVVSSAISVKEVLLGGDQTSTLTLNDSLTVGENLRVMGLGTLVASKPSTISNDLTVLDGGTLTHGENTSTEANKIDLTVGGDFYLGNDAEIDADYAGYTSSQGPGEGNYGRGASHGGEGGWGANADDRNTYGSVIAPTNCGSGGATGADGGGAVKLAVTGETRLYGYVKANGHWPTASSYGAGGSGGSIFLTTGTLVGNGTLEAEGGYSPSYPGGGGGRISVVLNSGTSFGQVDMRVRGGNGGGGGMGGATYRGANGTIYKQIGTDAAGAGTVIVDCDGKSPDSTAEDSATILPPDTMYVANELANATLIVTNDDTHLRLSDALYVAELLIYTNTTVTLGTTNLHVDVVEHYLDDVDMRGPGGPTNAVDNYSQIIWAVPPPGLNLIFK